MPVLDVSELNIALSLLGIFVLVYGFVSVRIKQALYLGEAFPALVFGVLFGPIAIKFLDPDVWAKPGTDGQHDIAYGISRVVIGLQLVSAGFQLPKQYQKLRWKEMAICLVPVMALMWIFSTVCIIITIPHLNFVSALVLAACVACTDPVLSQAVAKGPFADKFIRRPLRQIISSEAGANDGFAFVFLTFSIFLVRTLYPITNGGTTGDADGEQYPDIPQFISLGGKEHPPSSVGDAFGEWFVEGFLYITALGVVYGVFIGFASCKLLAYASRKKLIDGECYLLWPTAMGLFITGTCGVLGIDDTLACFAAGNALNWDGRYLSESHRRHEEFNACVGVLLNFVGFIYIGTILPWEQFHNPSLTGITIPRLIGLGFLLLLFRRIPAILITYKFMPKVCQDWKEAIFMGYFGPIGIGAVSYVEYARRLLPEEGTAEGPQKALVSAMVPVVFWLVFFSVVVHGLSVPVLNLIYKWRKVPTVQDDPIEIDILSRNEPLPKNSVLNSKRRSMILNNRFSGPDPPDLERSDTGDSAMAMIRTHSTATMSANLTPSASGGLVREDSEEYIVRSRTLD